VPPSDHGGCDGVGTRLLPAADVVSGHVAAPPPAAAAAGAASAGDSPRSASKSSRSGGASPAQAAPAPQVLLVRPSGGALAEGGGPKAKTLTSRRACLALVGALVRRSAIGLVAATNTLSEARSMRGFIEKRREEAAADDGASFAHTGFEAGSLDANNDPVNRDGISATGYVGLRNLGCI
jgi:hypothetical protein